MWAYVKDGSIVQTNTNQTRLTIRGTEFPAKYANEWSVADKKAYGVYEVVEDSTNLKDGAYYTNGASTFTFASDTVTLTYASATAKEVNDTKWTQAQIDDSSLVGEAPAGADTNTARLTGLKTSHKATIKSQAHSQLSHTDWYASRKAEAGTAIPGAVATYRAAVRTKENDMKTLIGNAADVDALAALYDYNDDTPPVRPLGEWPDPVS